MLHQVAVAAHEAVGSGGQRQGLAISHLSVAERSQPTVELGHLAEAERARSVGPDELAGADHVGGLDGVLD